MTKRVVYAYMLDSDDITDIHLIENPFLQRALWRSEVLYNRELSSQHKFDKKKVLVYRAMERAVFIISRSVFWEIF